MKSSSKKQFDTGKERDVERLTLSCVRRLNKAAQEDAEHWIIQGKLVDEYISKMKKNGKCSEDLYKKLADHETSILHASQLRNVHGAYLLRHKLGGKKRAPKVSVTHFTLVLYSGFTTDNKRMYLELAEKKHLSVRDLKKLIDEQKRTKKPEDNIPDVSVDWKKTVDTLERLTERAFSKLSHAAQVRDKRPIPLQLQNKLATLVRLIFSQGFIRWEEIKPDEDKKVA